MAGLTAIYVVGTMLICWYNRKAIKTALQLHEAVHRPVVVCDFLTKNTILYFRVRNIGNQAAENVRVSAIETPPREGAEKTVDSLVRNGFTFLSPGMEMCYLYCMPGVSDLPKVEFVIDYCSRPGRQFKERYTIDLHAWLKEDLGRESNDPLVQKLGKIADSLKKIADKGN
jgi:hypothetical protein